jgi:UMF1 family MFS transporter
MSLALSVPLKRKTALSLLLGSGGLWLSLVFFVVANCFYQAGLIFYDALLPAVSTPETRGRIGGIGVGVGYVGSLLGIGMGLTVTTLMGEDEKPMIFRLTALLFALFALPCFFWVKEVPRADAVPFGRESARRAWHELGETARRARRYPRLTRFLAGRLFYTDAANTMIATMGIYATKEVGFSDAEVQVVLAAGIVAAGDRIRRLPWLALAGDRDERYTAAARRIAREAPRARAEIVPDAGHAAHLQRPQRVAELIEEFLNP